MLPTKYNLLLAENEINSERENLNPVIPCSTSWMKYKTPGYTYGVSRQEKNRKR